MRGGEALGLRRALFFGAEGDGDAAAAVRGRRRFAGAGGGAGAAAKTGAGGGATGRGAGTGGATGAWPATQALSTYFLERNLFRASRARRRRLAVALRPPREPNFSGSFIAVLPQPAHLVRLELS